MEGKTMEDKSTNVRNVRAGAPRLLRAGVSALAAVSPGVAASAVAPLFFRAPPRRGRPDPERQALARGDRVVLGAGRDRIVAWRWGDGPAVLLAHGWGGCAGQMTPLVGPLLDAGFGVVAHDAPAHGESPGRTASIPVFADAIARVSRAVGPLHGVIAHSMGGAAFTLAASRGLSARRAVFVGPPSDAAAWFRGFVRWLALPAAAEPALRARVEAIAGERLDRLNSAVLGPRMKVPLLVLHDRQDREVPIEDGERVAREAADGRLVVTDGLGHRRILRDPGVAGQAVRFLAEGLEAAALPAA
jgi:pimeloyl-ACP methyl ester carboxylesterase